MTKGFITQFIFFFSVSPIITFDREKDSVNITAGSGTEITCLVKSFPEATVYWTHTKDGETRKIQDCGKTSLCRIYVYANRPSEIKLYSCVASHDSLGQFSRNLSFFTKRKTCFVFLYALLFS